MSAHAEVESALSQSWTTGAIRVLHLEDDAMDRRAFARMVREKNLPYEVTEVETLAEARAELAQGQFDIIISDYHLPDGHSDELFDEVPSTPFILITGTLEEQLALRTLQRGADDYLIKDARLGYLDALPFTVEKTLHRKRLRESEQRITQQLRKSQETLRKSELRYRSLFESIDEGFCVMEMLFDENGNPNNWRYLEVNPAFEKHSGLAQAAGKTMLEIAPKIETRWFDVYGKVALTGEPVRSVEFSQAFNRWFDLYAFRVEEPERRKVAVLFKNITGRKKSEEALRQAQGQLRMELQGMNLLHELSTRFVRGDDARTLLEAVLDSAIAITHADKGQIQLLKITVDELDVAAHRGLDQSFVEFFSHIRPGVAACGTAMQTRHCVVVEDVTRSPLFLAAPRALELMVANGVRAAVCTPLLTRAGQLVGVLSTHYPVPSRPSERDLHLLDMLARQAADFLERLRSDQALEAARKELAQANADLERKVQERTAKLQETVSELEHFSYTITHDMRAPLRAMQGFAHLMLEGECAECLDETAKTHLGRIKAAARRMDALITDALQYAQTLQGKFPLKPVDVAALLRELLETYPNLQPPQALIRLDGEFPRVLGNEGGLTQCFSNLLANAVKYVPPGATPQVRLWAEPRGDFVRVWVEDNGIGIAKEHHERIWSMFQRLEKKLEGTGIGLALVQKAVSRMGGRVGVESEPGAGSRFWVELKATCEG